MKDEYKYNSKSIIAGLVCTLVGIILTILDIFTFKTERNIWISIGCSLIASGVVILLTAFFVEKNKINPLDEWKIENIFKTRAEGNIEADFELKRAQSNLDAIAFGLKSFRDAQNDEVLKCLNRGVNIRILTMDPSSDFIKQRELEEKETENQIKNSIINLIQWANDLNKKSQKGSIVVRGYNTMTLDFYWRIDDKLLVGPYWFGRESQQTITYMYKKGGKGFELYSKYFESLWNETSLCVPLTELKKTRTKKRK